ncbi:MAG: YqaE/Pmp3 family rane protein [Sphingomonas bacterium]|nr:YqaE/Pmp3 family membrane protein [Sphingomonas bacterium]MDB5690562.1 YqaE/Pmp3 family rane protein [Sphingomonas bacterium]
MASKPANTGRSAAAIVAALFLPPLGVFLDSGITRAFWITTILTLLFFVPGLIFALFTILRPAQG